LHLFSDLVNLHISFYLFLSLLMLDWCLLDKFIAYCFFSIYIRCVWIICDILPFIIHPSLKVSRSFTDFLLLW
jgi:hypothetical protein